MRSPNNILSKLSTIRLNERNVIVTNHFNDQTHKGRGVNPGTIRNPIQFMRSFLRKLDISDIKLQRAWGKDRIVISKNGFNLIIAYDAFIKSGVIVLITLLKKGMRLNGNIIKSPSNKYKREKGNGLKNYKNKEEV